MHIKNVQKLWALLHKMNEARFNVVTHIITNYDGSPLCAAVRNAVQSGDIALAIEITESELKNRGD